MTNIVWLASYPKSGNTWVRAFLDNLLHDARKPLAIDRPSGMFAQGESAIGWYRIADPRPPSQWTSADIARLRPRVHKMIADSAQGTVFCKTHNALTTIDGHPTVNMAVSAGAIYIVRNPLDIVLSFADFQACSTDMAITIMGTDGFATPTNARNVSEHMASWSQHVASWTAGENRGVHVVRYEDLLERPVKSFTAIASYLGQKFERKRIERAIGHASFDSLRRQEEQHGFSEKPSHQKAFFRKGTAGQWRRELTPEQAARVIADHREQMARFGYLPEGA